MLITITTCLMLTYLSAFMGRIDGGGMKEPVNEWVERIGVMLPLVFSASLYVGDIAILALIGMFGIAIGHGQYFMNRVLLGMKQQRERTDFVVNWIMGADWRVQFDEDHKFTKSEKIYFENYVYRKLYWRNTLGMAVNGLVLGLPACVLLLWFGHWEGLIFLLTAPVKAGAYLAGWELSQRTKLVKQFTVFGEYGNGGGRGVISSILYLMRGA